MVLGLVIGGIFERYLFISTELYGWGWLLRPVVLAILACVVWALYRPMSQIVRDIAHELRDIKHHKFRLTASASFTIVVMAVITAAVISGHDWPPQAKVVPFTAAGLALSAAGLNLVNELFGKQTLIAIGGSADSGSEAGTGGAGARAHAGDRALARHPVLRMDRVPVRAGLCDRLHSRDRRVCLPVHVARLRRALVRGAGLCRRHDRAVLGRLRLGAPVPWPQALLGEWFPELRSATGLF